MKTAEGTVIARRPGGMVDIRRPDGVIVRRSASSLKSNPGVPMSYAIKLIKNGKNVGHIGGYGTYDAAAGDAQALVNQAGAGTAARVVEVKAKAKRNPKEGYRETWPGAAAYTDADLLREYKQHWAIAAGNLGTAANRAKAVKIANTCLKELKARGVHVPQHVETRGGRVGSLAWWSQRSAKGKTNPYGGPLTLTHEGADVVIRHTNANPKQQALRISAPTTKKTHTVSNPQTPAQRAASIVRWMKTPGASGRFANVTASDLRDRFGLEPSDAHVIAEKWLYGGRDDIPAFRAYVARQLGSLKNNPRGVPKPGSKGAKRQAFMSVRLKQLRAAGYKPADAMRQASADWRAKNA